MSPLPGWQVIPAGFNEHHRPTANAGHVSAVQFQRVTDGPAPYPEPEGWSPVRIIWETTARVEPLNRGGGGAVFADQPTYTQEFQVSTAAWGPPVVIGERGDIILSEGRALRIIREDRSDLDWERVFICVDNNTQQNPEGGTA